MLPSAATGAMQHILTVVIKFIVIAVVSAFVGMVLARTFGGTSRSTRQAIFSVVVFIGCAVGGYFLLKGN
jgi:hypothetical protein